MAYEEILTTSTGLPLSGGTMTGTLTLKSEVYADTATTGALNAQNSDLYNVNSIKFCDLSDTAAEGLQWYRTSTTVDSIWVKTGVIYFTPNRTWGSTATNYTVLHSGNYSSFVTKLGTTTVGSATQPIYLNVGAPTACTYTLGASVPSGAKFTDTVTTVTTSGSGNAVTAISASNGALTVTKGSTFLTTVTKANVTSALGYTPCRAWTVTIPSGSSGSKAITVSGATFGKSPLIAKSSGSDDDYNKITAVSATTNTLTFTLSSATSAALTLTVIETF